MTQVFVILM